MTIKRLIAQHMPPTIHYAERGDTSVYWFTLGMQAPEWQVAARPLPSWIETKLQEVNHVVGGAGPTVAHLTTVYMVRYPVESFSPFSVEVDQFLTDRAEREVQRWWQIEGTQAAAIECRDWGMTRFPDETLPCPEMAGVGRLRATGEAGPVTVQDLFEDLRAIRALTVVPESVWSLLNRAAKLYAFGYLEWEFFTMAQHQATMALEASLKALYMRDRAVPLRVQVRDGQNSVVKEREFREGLKSYRVLAQAVDSLREGYRSWRNRAPIDWWGNAAFAVGLTLIMRHQPPRARGIGRGRADSSGLRLVADKESPPHVSPVALPDSLLYILGVFEFPLGGGARRPHVYDGHLASGYLAPAARVQLQHYAHMGRDLYLAAQRRHAVGRPLVRVLV